MPDILSSYGGRAARLGTPDSSRLDRSEQDLDLEALTLLCNQAAFDVVSQPVVFFSAPTSRLIHVNRAAANRLGYTPQQLQSMSLLDIAPQATSANLAELCGRATCGANQEARVKTVFRHRSGSLIPVQCSIRALAMLPESIFVAVAHELPADGSTRSRRVATTLRDSLTSLPNREWLWNQLERAAETARRSDYRFAVLFIDIDRFKEINDSHGHLAGDHVLQAVARRLKASVRPNDAVGRYGGDEFVVLIKGVDADEDIRRIAERIGRRLEVKGSRRGRDTWRTHVTVSIGAAISGGLNCNTLDAIERADRAMYRAKALGRNGQFVVDDSLESSPQSNGICTESAEKQVTVD